jgi:hypothetical protein
VENKPHSALNDYVGVKVNRFTSLTLYPETTVRGNLSELLLENGMLMLWVKKESVIPSYIKQGNRNDTVLSRDNTMHTLYILFIEEITS